MKQINVGIDIGYSNTKIAYGDGAYPHVKVIPSGVGPVEAYSEEPGLGIEDKAGADIVEINGRRYVAGVEQSHLRTKRNRHSDYPSSEEYLALYYRALRLLPGTNIDTIITGVPVEQHRDSKFCERLVARLRGRHVIKSNLTVFIEDVIVIPQPVGAYADAGVQMLEESDREIVREGRTLVVDPGFYSTDWAMFYQGRLVRSASGSNNCAMGLVLEGAVRRIEQQLGNKVRIERIEQALRRGARTILFRGKHLDFAPYLDSALKEVNRENATDLLNATNLEQEQIDLVIIAGGGAEYFRVVVSQALPGCRVVLPPRPVAANVRGYWYLARARQMASATVTVR